MASESAGTEMESRPLAAATPALDDLASAARRVLVIGRGGAETGEIFWGRAKRLRRLVQRLLELPDVRAARHDRRAVEAAALFADAAWADDVRSGRIAADAVWLQVPDMRQRELSADILNLATADVLGAETRRVAGRAIRESGMRRTALTEALVLGEAIELEGIGPEWLLVETRRAWVRGHDSSTLVEQWRKQQEYGYWEGRIRDRLRFDWSRKAARQRLAGLAAFMETFAAQIDGET